MEQPVLVLYRVGAILHRSGLVRTAKLLAWINRIVFCAWVPGAASIGRRVRLGYLGLGVVIHSRAVIGDDVVIAQNVTIGRKAGVWGVPVIKRGVYIGSGACVLGDITIGEDAVVGANAVVLLSVPPRAVVAGVPARIIRVKGPELGSSDVE